MSGSSPVPSGTSRGASRSLLTSDGRLTLRGWYADPCTAHLRTRLRVPPFVPDLRV
jgi:hypothetical protein